MITLVSHHLSCSFSVCRTLSLVHAGRIASLKGRLQAPFCPPAVSLQAVQMSQHAAGSLGLTTTSERRSAGPSSIHWSARAVHTDPDSYEVFLGNLGVPSGGVYICCTDTDHSSLQRIRPICGASSYDSRLVISIGLLWQAQCRTISAVVIRLVPSAKDVYQCCCRALIGYCPGFAFHTG